MELRTLRECIQDRDMLAAQIAAGQQKDGATMQDTSGSKDPTVFKSRVRGNDLHKFMSHDDTFEEDICKGYSDDKMFRKILPKVDRHPMLSMKNRVIWARNRGGEDIVCIPSTKSQDMTLRMRIVDQVHQVVGHFGPQQTIDYIRWWYWWPSVYLDVEKFCKSCEICTQVKGNYQVLAGKTHPLPIPTRPWESVGMDFGLFPEVENYNYVWVVICRMSFMVHLILVNTRMTASQLSVNYMHEVVCLHGLPSSIVFNQDPKFTSKWWHKLHRIMGTKLLMSTLFHPQMDGATEWANRSVGQMFRAMVNPDQKDWVQKSPLIKFVINSSIGSATGLALFKINCRYMPVIMTELRDVDKAPPGVQTFAQQALCNMAVAHDTLIEV
jgi:Integrase zinc binding domain